MGSAIFLQFLLSGAAMVPVPEAVIVQVPASPVVVQPAPPPIATSVLPANTEVLLTPVEDAHSKKLKKGDSFAIETLADVMHRGFIVIPRGTKGQATITWRTGTGVFAKTGKMEMSIDWLELVDGRKLPLNGKYRHEGQGNLVPMASALFVAGVAGGLLVTGKSAVIRKGDMLYARTAEGVAYKVSDHREPMEVVTLLPRAKPAVISNRPPAP